MKTPDHENQQDRPGRPDRAEGHDGYEYPGGAEHASGPAAGGPAGAAGGSAKDDGPAGRHREEAPWGHPQAQSDPAAPGPSAGPRRAGYGVVIGVLTAVVGGIALAGSAGSEAFAAVGSINREDTVRSADASGITDLDVDADGASLTVAFGDVDQAVLEVRNGTRDGWRIQRENGELTVGKRDDWCIMWCHREREDAVLTLPEELNDGSLNADLSLDAGELRAEGAFADLETTVNAGAMTVSGSARTLDAEVSAGRADLDLSGVERGRFDVSAGRMNAELTGDAPSDLGFDVSAGALNLTLPDAAYRVDVERSAGSLNNRLDTGGAATSTITGELSAGDVTLRPGR